MSAFSELISEIRIAINHVIKIGATNGHVRTEDHNPLEHLIIDAIELHAADQDLHSGGLPAGVTGDLLYYSEGAWIRLPKGDDGQVLSLDSGLPEWVDKGLDDVSDDDNPILGGDLNADNFRILESQGSDIASANNLTLDAANDGNVYNITGTTEIRSIDRTKWLNSHTLAPYGARITLRFTGVLTIKHNYVAPGDFTAVVLAKGADYTTKAGDVLSFRLIDGVWYEDVNTAYEALRVNQTSITSSATPTPTGNYKENEYFLTALAEAAAFAEPSGTPANGNTLLIRIKDDGTARALSFNAAYKAFFEALPTTTVLGKTMYLGFIYDSAASKWNYVSKVDEV